jgi:ATP-dependent DNA helicase RecG
MKEGTYFDRKSARKEPREIAQHFIGFANAGGEILAVGIEDNGELAGFQKYGAKSFEKFNTVIYEYCKNTPVVTINRVSFQHDDGSDDFVLVFTVEPSLNLVIHASNDDVYLR